MAEIPGNRTKHKNRKSHPHHVQHNSVLVEEFQLLEWIEYIAYVLHDEDLSLKNADTEIVEILESFEKDFRELADKSEIEWRNIWGESDAGVQEENMGSDNTEGIPDDRSDRKPDENSDGT